MTYEACPAVRLGIIGLQKDDLLGRLRKIWVEDFEPTSDKEVRELLAQAHDHAGAAT